MGAIFPLGLPGIFEGSLFSRFKAMSRPASPFLRPMHPKTGIRPRPDTIQRVLQSGWVAQLKIHGHRAQIHVSSNPSEPVLVYNRQGRFHKKVMPTEMVTEVRRIFSPKKGWTVIDAEWLKGEDKLYVFDIMKKEGELLRKFTFPERWKLLPRLYLSPHVMTLPLIKGLEECLEALKGSEPHIEGLIFKSLTTPGFSDTSIIRCRRSAV